MVLESYCYSMEKTFMGAQTPPNLLSRSEQILPYVMTIREAETCR